ncbi:MAG TPA: MaoC/PaaZ C-terminal domain-containing protein [Steroidobacteraceae bacterium]|nr:MaoC/PaaZ C-terminal domain-containing protein [Steroidobacteraceae bacterium]
MRGPVSLHFSSAPGIVPAYLRILFSRKPAFVADGVPRIEAVLGRFEVNPRHLARYRKVCGDRESDELPITYPHILATPVHLAMIACEAFPVSLLGVVHVRNRIVQHRPLHVHDAGSIRSWLEGYRETSRGQELDLQTQVQIGADVVWSETSTFLARHRDRRRLSRTGEPAMPNVEMPPRQDVTTSTFIVSPAVGRQYARVSGDFNPIHIADVGARFFGLKRAIAHGMWSLARCAAEIGGNTFAQPCTLDVAFRRPIAFCARMVLESWMTDGRVGFSLRDQQADRGHLLGTVVRAS